MMKKGWKRAIELCRECFGLFLVLFLFFSRPGSQRHLLLPRAWRAKLHLINEIIKRELVPHGRRAPSEPGGSGDRHTLASATPPGPDSPPRR